MFIVFLFIFAVVCAINCLYYLFFFKFVFSKQKKGASEVIPVSVIVYLKNEEATLRDYLPTLISQTHPQFEIILVNNASYDNTLEILEEFQALHNNVRIVDVENNEAFWGSKKYALTLGIKKAQYKQLLFTTPSSEPVSNEWTSEMSSLFTEKKHFILGYANYKKTGSFLNRIMRFSRLQSNLQNFGFASINKPYSAWENNVGYTSDLFFENSGFSSHMSIPTGTEDLFTKQATTASNVALAFDTKHTTLITNCNKFSDWTKQRKFQTSTLKHYNSTTKISLGLLYFSQLAFWILAIVGAIVFQHPYIYGLIALRFLIAGIVIGKAAFKFSEKDLFYLFPLWELFNISIQLSIFIRNLFSNSTS